MAFAPQPGSPERVTARHKVGKSANFGRPRRTLTEEMRVRRTLLVVALAIVAASAATASARAAQTYQDRVTGHEYYFTSTEGRFAGTASGDLPGAWNAVVRHTPLCVSCHPTATITGGSFSLTTVLHGVPALVVGSFTGGSVQVTNVGANCTDQTFDVEGVLGNVGRWPGGTGSGTFSATLTHFRHRVFGICITYAASVNGTLTLSF
jgi:hypothetical protein